MTKRAKPQAPGKSMTRRRRISNVAARQAATKRKTPRKQTIRQSRRRRGGQ